MATLRRRGFRRRSIRCWVRASRWRKETALSLPVVCRWPRMPGLAGTWCLERCCCLGTAFVELALAAAQRVGLDTVDELTLEAPLVIPERGAVQLQVLVGGVGGEQAAIVFGACASGGRWQGRLDAACQRGFERGGERHGGRPAGLAAGWGGGG